jgi:hypothetical protein
MRQLDRMQEQLRADASEERRSDVRLVIDGARTLADTGDDVGCECVSSELDKGAQTQQSQGGDQPTVTS